MVLAGVEDGAVLAHAACPVVEATDELAHDQQVDALRARGAQVGVDTELGSQPQQSLLGANVGCVELGVADRAFEDSVGREAGCEGRVGKRVPARPDRRGAERVFLEGEVRRELGEHPPRGGGELGPDAVTEQEDDRHGSCYPCAGGTTTRTRFPPAAEIVVDRQPPGAVVAPVQSTV